MPPLTDVAILPLVWLPPLAALHETLATVVVTAMAAGCPTVALLFATQPLASVTVTLYVPAESPAGLTTFAPLLQAKLYVPVPPETVVARLPLAWLPVLLLLHDTPVAAIDEMVSDAGWPIVAVAAATQLCASVTVTVYDPVAMPVRLAVTEPLFHAYVYAGVPPATVVAILPLL